MYYSYTTTNVMQKIKDYDEKVREESPRLVFTITHDNNGLGESITIDRKDLSIDKRAPPLSPYNVPTSQILDELTIN